MPTAAPYDVFYSSRTNTSLIFEWLEVQCGQRNGPNNYRYELVDDNEVLIDTNTTSDLSVTISDLESCAEYSFKVQAFNDAGNGEFSPVVQWETDIGGK